MWRQSQIRGHNAASLDPLGMFAADLDTSHVPELLLHTHDLGNTQHIRWVSCACNCFAVVKLPLTHTKEDAAATVWVVRLYCVAYLTLFC